MNLAAVVVHYDNPEITSNILRSLETSDAIQKRIAVLHDHFPEETNFTRTVFLKSENLGYAAGINRAMHHLIEGHPEISHAIVLNCDVEITDVQINSIIQEHVAAGADCTFPAVREGHLVLHGYRLNKLGLLRPSRNGASLYPGTCFLISVEAWKKAGKLNEKYFHYFEDIDFCLRMEKAGLRIHHAPKIVLNHSGVSRADYPGTQLPRYAVRNHLWFLDDLGKLNALSYLSVIAAHFLYLFRWKHGWRGIKTWMKGIQEFKNR